MRRRIATALLLAVAGLALTPGAAAAHPLGNFTTNQYTGIRVAPSGVDVDYVLDLAELPAYQARQQEIDTDGDGTASPAERDTYAGRTCAAVATATRITVAGRPAPTTGQATALTFPAGAGGLTTLRLECALHAAARMDGNATIAVRAGFLPDRIGWREITAIGDRYTLTRSSVPATSVSARLTAYPGNAATSDVRSADLDVRPGGPAASAFAGEQAFAAPDRGADRLTRWFTGLVGHPRLTWGVGILAFLIAVLLGGLHAAAPGHGKTIMAAYLVGARGRLGHALTLAVTVAATHTAGVLALGVILATSMHLAPQDLYEWLRLASGVLIALVGAHLLRRAFTVARAGDAGAQLHAHAAGTHDHTHPHTAGHGHPDDHGHPHPHDHGHPHDHDHGHPHDHEHPHPHPHPHPHDHDQPHNHPHPHDDDSHHHDHGDPDTHDHGPHGHDHDHPRLVPAHREQPEFASVRSGQTVAAPARPEGAVLTHAHGGGHPHSHHLPAPDEPFRPRTVLAMGFAGGLSPSPSAVVVLLGAAALGRAWYGVLLVLAYGIGLAAVLTGLGFALAHWGGRLRSLSSGRLGRLLTLRLPAVTAAAILLVGLGMATLAVSSLLATTP